MGFCGNICRSNSARAATRAILVISVIVVTVALIAIGQTVFKGQTIGKAMTYAAIGLYGAVTVALILSIFIKKKVVDHTSEYQAEQAQWADYPFKDSAEMAKAIIDSAYTKGRFVYGENQIQHFETFLKQAREEQVKASLEWNDEDQIPNRIGDQHLEELQGWVRRKPACHGFEDRVIRQRVFYEQGMLLGNSFLGFAVARTWAEVLANRAEWAEKKLPN